MADQTPAAAGNGAADYSATLRQALGELRHRRAEIAALRAHLAAHTREPKPQTAEPIAVVGMACRLPGGCDTPASFWELLDGGRCAASEIPAERWPAGDYYDPDPGAPGKMTVRRGSFARGAEEFDAAFFGISPREAASMDPQQRLLLEVAWEALENAHLPASGLFGSKTGVFCGITCFDHAMRLATGPDGFGAYAGTGSALNTAAGRLSYWLGVKGPSMAIDTACSSSLVGVHLACQSLRSRESDLALACGVHLILSPDVMVTFSQARMLSPDGLSKAFAASADGYGRGEGCGVVVLKRLAEAQRDGDRILGVIRGSATNHCGASGGLTVPLASAQQAVIRAALEQAGVAPHEVGYVEAHGTGTPLGDPIEIEAMAAAYGEGRAAGELLWTGSLKSNIGHLEPASGVAGLIKLLLALQHRRIPRSLHFDRPNPHIGWDELPVRVAGEGREWTSIGGRRIAGLSAFGFSGTNAHVIVEAWDRSHESRELHESETGASPGTPPPRGLEKRAGNGTGHRQFAGSAPQLVISAKTATALRQLAQRYLDLVERMPEAQLPGLCTAANLGRDRFEKVLTVAAGSRNETCAQLRAYLAGAAADGRARLVLDSPSASTDPGERREGGWKQVELPNYPFERQHYPLAGKRDPKLNGQTGGEAAAQALSTPIVYQPGVYQVEWIAAPAPSAEPEPSGNDRESPGGAGPLNARKARWLVVTGAPSLPAGGGTGPEPDLAPDPLATEFMRALAARGVEPVAIEAGAPLPEGEFDRIVRVADPMAGPGVHLLGLMQAMVARWGARAAASSPALHVAPRLWVITRGATEPDGGAREQGLAESLAVGLAKTFFLEHPEFAGAVLDLHAEPQPGEAGLLIAEVLGANQGKRGHAEGIPGEDLVALRGGKRWVPRLVERSGPDSASSQASLQAPPQTPLVFPADHTYLITGGLGALGLLTARWLVQHGARSLILAGRRGADSDAAQCAVADLEALGASVRCEQVDVADREAMRRLFNACQADRTLSGIRGVIHAAGAGAYRDLAATGAADWEQTLRAKVTGAQVLDELTRGLPLDFFVCYSSIASVWGSKGLAAYSAANRYLDALAHRRRAMDLPALTVNWGPWAEGGMNSPEATDMLRRMGLRPLTAARALDTMGALLLRGQTGTGGQSPASIPPQAIIADIDWPVFLGMYEARGRKPFFDRIGRGGDRNQTPAQAKHTQPDAFERKLAAADLAGRRVLLADLVLAETARVLQLASPPDRERGFFDLGMDSLLALELRTRLESLVGRPLPATLIFEHPTPEALAGFLLAECGDATDAAAAPDDTASIQNEAQREAQSKAQREAQSNAAGSGPGVQQGPEPIAIVGMGCRFPGQARDPESFWQLLRDGVDAVTEVPAERWNAAQYYDPDPGARGKMYSTAGGFLDQVDRFDAAFFHISRRGAASMDPQHRILLEVSWEALESAGISARAVRGSETGVFVGITTGDYGHLQMRDSGPGGPDSYFFTGNPLNTAAGRLAYTFGFSGPAMAIDTACSSSLVAVHQASQALRAGECGMALAAGVNLVLAPETTIAVARTRALSPDGRCKTFDASANGFVRSEGCGVVVLKTLSRARQDGDRVLAVIRGSAVNQDGASSGFTVPSGKAQEQVIRKALGAIDPSEIDYLEAHGTGTQLGDPLEVRALAAVFAPGRGNAPALRTGSVKSAIGHAEAAAGMAGLIKVVLALQHGELPPSLHVSEPNPLIDWASLPIEICRTRQAWPPGTRPRMAGVSAFGASGTNAHVVVEEVKAVEEAEQPGGEAAEETGWRDSAPAWPLVLSAHTQAALMALAERYRVFLETVPSSNGNDDQQYRAICYAAAVGRSPLRHRLAVAAHSRRQAIAALEAFAAGRSVPELYVRDSKALDAKPGDPGNTAPPGDAIAVAAPLPSAAGQWVRGADFPQIIAGGRPLRRVSLPLYPFQGERIWFQTAPTNMEPLPQPAGAFAGPPPGPPPQPREAPGSAGPVDGPPERSTGSPDNEQSDGSGPISDARAAIAARLRDTVATLLDADASAVDEHTPFLEMGADSLVLVDLMQQIEQHYAIKLGVRSFFEDLSTLGALADHIAAHTKPFEPEHPEPEHPEPEHPEPEHPTPVPPDRIPAANPGDQERQETTNLGIAPGFGEGTDEGANAAILSPMATQSGNGAGAVERVIADQLRLLERVLAQQLAAAGGAQASNGAIPSNGPAPSNGAAPINSPAQGTAKLGAEDLAATSPNRAATKAGAAPSPAPEASATEPSGPPRPQALLPWGVPTVKRGGLSPLQQRMLEELTGRFTARTARSKQIAAASRRHLADSRATVGFRFSTKEMLYPIVGERSNGARVWDADGNEYVDFTMGFGVHLFGHRPEFVDRAVAAELARGVELGTRSPLAGEVASLFAQLTGHERVAFCNSGTEAVMAAMRLARAATGRNKIVLFTHSYHGHSDGTLAAASTAKDGRTIAVAPGVPSGVVEDIVVLEYGAPESLQTIAALAGDPSGDLAAVMVEPVQSRNPALQPVEFVRELRRITHETGVALIFDEMITGLRVGSRGAQGWFGVEADLATYGKVAGGGLPIGIVAGRARFLDGIDGGAWQYGDASYPAAERTAFGGTFCQHPLAMAAARAVLEHLIADGGKLQEQLNQRTARLAGELNSYFETAGAPIRVTHFASLFRFEFSSNLDLFFYRLLEQGFYIWEWRTCFLSTAHTEADLAAFVQAIENTVEWLREGGWIAPPSPVAKAAMAEAAVAKAAVAGHPAPASALQKTPSHNEVPASQDQASASPGQAAGAAGEPVRAPLSEAQRQLWRLNQIDPAGLLAYQIALAVELEGDLDIPRLERAVEAVTTRHEALRTTIASDSEQCIWPPGPVPLPLIDVSSQPIEPAWHNFEEWHQRTSRELVDLAAGPLYRFHLVRLEPQRHVLHLTAHHIVSDGATLSLLLGEIIAGYRASSGKGPENGPETAPPAVPYRTYLNAQAQRLASAGMEVHRGYWLEQCAGMQALELPGDRPSEARKTYAGGRLHFAIGEQETQALRNLARGQHATLYALLLAVFQVFLHRVSGQSEAAVGMPVSDRAWPGTQSVAGYCTHLTPLRSSYDASASFAEFLKQTQTTILAALEHQEYPYAELLRELAARGGAGAPVSVVFNLEPASAPPEIEGLRLRPVQLGTRFTAFDLTVNVTDLGKALEFDWDYSAARFERETVEGFWEAYRNLLAAASTGAQRPVSRLRLAELEIAGLASQPAAAAAPSVVERFDRQAAAHPERMAVLSAEPSGSNGGGAQLTYRALCQRAEAIGGHLRSLGIGPGSKVGVCVGRTPDLIAALLGIWKAGAAYVPLDPGYPAARLRFMLEDAAIGAVITDRASGSALDSAASANILKIAIDGVYPAPAEPFAPADPRDTAYVIYTSGSSGRPKGVVVPHGNVAGLVEWASGFYTPRELEGVLFSTSISFDVSVFEIFAPLALGGTLVMAGDVLELPGSPLAGQVRLVSTVPSAAAELLRAGPLPASVETVQLAGEVFPPALAAKIYGNPSVRRALNLYGPTEDTVYSTAAEVAREDLRAPAIGRPLPGKTALILDAGGEPVPRGLAGELYLGGWGVADGYLNLPKQTRERFLDRHSETSGEPPLILPSAVGRLYRTGDRVRLRRDGEIEFLGRNDNQVKIRGFRIELGEIEAALAAHPAVTGAVVTAGQGPDGARLIAYVTSPEPESEIAPRLHRHLETQLPHYMALLQLAVLAEFPRLPNGKIDRGRLPDPGTEGSGAVAVTLPRDETEQCLAGIWSRVTGRPSIGVFDNFFEIGGDSLSATRVAAEVRASLAVELEVRSLFTYPTIAALAREIGRMQRVRHETVRPAEPRDTYDLTPLQRSFWAQAHLHPEAAAVAPQCFLIRPSGEASANGADQTAVDPASIARAFDLLIDRHEILRTVFPAIDGHPRMRILSREQLGFAVHHADTSAADDPVAEAMALLRSQAVTPMDLSRGPLLRVTLIRLGPDRYLCACSQHHIITDGWSMEVLRREFLETYTALAAAPEGTAAGHPPLEIQFKDYAVWLNRMLQGERGLALRDYWVKTLGGAADHNEMGDARRAGSSAVRGARIFSPPPAPLASLVPQVPVVPLVPLDTPREQAGPFERRSHRFRIEPHLARDVEALGRRYLASPYMVLLAALGTGLHRAGGGRDIVIGSPMAGRVSPELAPQIGPYLNLVAQRFHASPEDRFDALLERVRETVLDAMGHQLYPFERVVEQLGARRVRERNPVFDVGFTLQNQVDHAAFAPRLKPAADRAGELPHAPAPIRLEAFAPASDWNAAAEARTDLWLIAEPGAGAAAGGLEIEAVYNGALLGEASIRQLAGHYVAVLRAVVENPHIRIGETPAYAHSQPAAVEVPFPAAEREPVPIGRALPAIHSH